MMVSTLQSFSKGSPHLIRIPFCAHLPVPTIKAVGVAKPSAHGQAITITAEKYNKEAVNQAPTTKNQIANTINAMMMTVGTNTAAILSANHWIGALDPCASWISLIICASAVSFPILVVSISKLHNLFIVPPNTFAPIIFSTGMLSPVNIDSSMLECHDIKTQSIGTFSPGLTMMISHFFTCSIGTSTNISPLLTFAVLGASPISLAMVCEVDHFAFASKNFPKDTNMISNPATSK